MLFDISSLIDPPCRANGRKDLFADTKRKAWKSVHKAEARCDFSPNNWRMNSRGILFLSAWKASIYGMTLSDNKADPSMPEIFAKNISEFITRFFNISTNSDSSVFFHKFRFFMVTDHSISFVDGGVMARMLQAHGKNMISFAAIKTKL